MSDLSPILLLPYTRQELRPKPGGGETPEPLVSLTSEFLGKLTSRLDALAEEAAAKGATPQRPMPMKIVLHPKALAKSNRPYALLESHAMPVVAVDRIGELIVAGTAGRIRSLSAAIASARSKKDRYFISTIEGFSAWEQARDIFRTNTEANATALLEAARKEGKLVKITLFPWMAATAPGNQEATITAPSSAPPTTSIEMAERYVDGTDLSVRSARFASTRPVIYVDPGASVTVEQLVGIPGVRTVSIAEDFQAGDRSTPQFYSPIRELDASEILPSNPTAPLVGVLDTGISSLILEPWVEERINYDVGIEMDPGHGTFVAGLVVDPHGMNGSGDAYPNDSARVIDAQVMPGSGISEAYLHERVAEVLSSPAAQGVKVWNCSFGSPRLGLSDYGTFAQDLDALSAEKQVLFVVAAGNYQGSPSRGWPPASGVEYADRISSPSESVRSLTVGARSLNGGMVAAGAPSSYTQRGPNFAAHVKPEVCHWAGDVSSSGMLGGFGVQSVVPSGHLAESIGTSFAAPIVSTIAANTWQTLELSGAVTQVRPELVKGLLIHSAAVADRSTESAYRDYYGWGVPTSSAEILGNDPGSFTTVHEVVLTPGTNWYKDPFPVPDCLLLDGNRFQGEVILTLSYSPPIDPAFGAESVRYDVAGSFGSFKSNSAGKVKFASITPGEKVTSELWEANQIAEGKWAPTKTYRKQYPQGSAGGQWALRLSLTERVSNEVQREQLVYAIITFRALDSGKPVYAHGVEAVNRLRYENREMVPTNRLRA
jgi:serine protease AprX